MSSGTVRTKLIAWDEAGAFLAFGLQAILPVVATAAILRSIFDIPDALVRGRIVPAAAVMICLGTFYYTWLARKLAAESGRSDVTTLPSGISQRHMVVCIFVVMWPVWDKTHNAIETWGTGLAWAFIQGIVLIGGAFLAPLLRRLTPRTALLGALAGTAMSTVILPAALDIAASPIIGIVCLMVILLEGLGGLRLIKKIPGGILTAIIGLMLAWGFVLAKAPFASLSWPSLKSAAGGVHLFVPYPALDAMAHGFGHFGTVIITALPFAIYDLVDSLNNVESAETAGDSFPLRRVLAGSGVVTLIGCLLGCPFVNGIHVGQPGWKALGGRTGYAAGAGIAILLAGCLGVTSLATALVPPVALMPLLLVAGILTVSRAFHDSPARYIPAFLLAMIPALAGWAKAQVDNGLGATGTAVDMLGIDKLYGEGVVYPGLQALGDGPTLVGIVLGALAVFVIDRKFMHATTTALVGAVLTFFGMMHAESFFGAIHAEAVGIGRSPQLVIAYLAAAVVLFLATRHAKRAT